MIPGSDANALSANFPSSCDRAFNLFLIHSLDPPPFPAGNSTRTGILWKMKVKLQKNSLDQIFTGENKKQAEFLTF